MTRPSSRKVFYFFVGVFRNPRGSGRRFGSAASKSAGSTSRAGRIRAISAFVSWRTSPSARINVGLLVSGLFGMMANLGPPLFHHAPQSATTSPGTRWNSSVFAVTSVDPVRRACAAISTS